MKLKTIKILTSIIVFLIIIEIILLIKFRFYAEWNFYSFLISYQSIVLLTGLISPMILIFIKAYRGTDSETFIIKIIRSRFETIGKAKNTVLILLIQFTLLFLAIVIFRESPYLKKITYYIENHNWEYAEKELNELDKSKIRPNIYNTYAYFILTHKETDIHNFPDGKILRERKNAVERLLFEDKFDYQLMNSLTIAEIYKSLYFSEDESSHISSGISRLAYSKENASVLLKKGELLLAIKDYSKAKKEFRSALNSLPNPTQESIILSNLGNILASEGAYTHAIDNYKKAELNYPEIRKFIFYSNYSYLLMLNKDYKSAEKKVRLALKINPGDWYSYLNLGLIQEKNEDYQDAIHNFNLVIEKTDNDDSKREAGILKGRCMEICGYEINEVVRVYLKALNKDFSDQSANYYLSNRDDLYNDLITGLKETNTHGIESYVAWFEKKLEE